MKRYTKVICAILSVILLLSVAEQASATTIPDLKDELEEDKSQLEDVKDQISDYEGAQTGVGEEIDAIDGEIVALLTDINLIKEAIEEKEADIEQAQLDYDAAVLVEQEQYEAMKVRIKFMYERGDASYLQILFSAKSMGDMINKTRYIQQVYEYDRKMLDEYEAIVKQVADLQDVLEEEKSELETSKTELEEEQTYMEEVLRQKKEEYENYGTMLAKAKQEAAVYTEKIRKETEKIRKLEEEERKRKEEEERKRKEEEERKKAEEEALLASQDDSDGSSDTEEEVKPKPVSGGSSKGQEIAKFACKFVGCPYVAGGTSLTNGADCSGFVMSVYKEFGISLPRSSYAQSSAGKAVSYSEAQPGDIIYYGGHVGIYIGNGQIVHASTERTGIKIAPATYRNIVTVRRIV